MYIYIYISIYLFIYLFKISLVFVLWLVIGVNVGGNCAWAPTVGVWQMQAMMWHEWRFSIHLKWPTERPPIDNDFKAIHWILPIVIDDSAWKLDVTFGWITSGQVGTWLTHDDFTPFTGSIMRLQTLKTPFATLFHPNLAQWNGDPN